MRIPKCNYCDRPARLTNGAKLYPNRPDVARRFFWVCEPCDAWVGCHAKGNFVPMGGGRRKYSDGTLPLGNLANKELRTLRMQVHETMDRLWKSGKHTRLEVYTWLGEQLNRSPANCHIGMFDEETCRKALDLCIPLEFEDDSVV